MIRVERFGFSYPCAQACGGEGREYLPQVLSEVTFSIEEGAFCVLCGPTGCGKTTLLRSLKPGFASFGRYEGTVEVAGVTVLESGEWTGAMSDRDSAATVGYVMQDPDAQIVCDTVWHEIAFGLENLGMPQDEMRRRIAEVAHFFGIESWIRASTETLSGGQKQLVCLAGALALSPTLLLLDEPTAQLDPNARQQFTSMLARINRELGVTVVMATHSPEDADPFITQRLDLGRIGRLVDRSSVEAPLAAWRVKRRQLLERAAPCIVADGVHFRYERRAPWVLRGIDVCVLRGSVHAFVGGNGCGKSTLIKAIAGLVKPQRGRMGNAALGSQALLPQDPKALFVCDTVAEEISEWRDRCGYGERDEDEILKRFGLDGHRDKHPYDLSGGQRQKLAFAKLLLSDPDLFLLDEPTKGLDAFACAEVVRIVRKLADEGRTVVMVTHDLDFAFTAADEVSMLFDGEVACTQSAEEFFSRSLVYRPSDASRLFGEPLWQSAENASESEARGE